MRDEVWQKNPNLSVICRVPCSVQKLFSNFFSFLPLVAFRALGYLDVCLLVLLCSFFNLLELLLLVRLFYHGQSSLCLSHASFCYIFTIHIAGWKDWWAWTLDGLGSSCSLDYDQTAWALDSFLSTINAGISVGGSRNCLAHKWKPTHK